MYVIFLENRSNKDDRLKINTLIVHCSGPILINNILDEWHVNSNYYTNEAKPLRPARNNL